MQPRTMDALNAVSRYHRISKHRFHSTAPGPGRLDWANQPDPFRYYHGAEPIALERVPPADEPPYEPVFLEGALEAAPLERSTLSQLLFDSLALSAWKRLGSATWALRVNPSSGNLHPTEGYIVCGEVEGVCEGPMVAHYVPREHALECRTELPVELWEVLSRGFPAGTLFFGLTSIHWREAWKYGERAYRYCQLDTGHAIAAISVAAAALGWRTRLLDGWGSEQIARLLGLDGPKGEVEPEEPECLLALMPMDGGGSAGAPGEFDSLMQNIIWQGRPNRLSEQQVHWPEMAQVAQACRKPPTGGIWPARRSLIPELPVGNAPFGLRPLVHRRRSAVDMDGRSAITRDAFYQMLRKCLPGPGQVPFAALPWRPQIHLALFVHRVQGLDPGLYMLLRESEELTSLQAALKPEFLWERPAGCPQEIPLYRLMTGDARELAQQLSCFQDIAANGCFAAAMLARFEPALREHGAWFYPRLYWEAGLIGQQLYLEACASGVAATGIGCYFDDPVHDVLGIADSEHQVLYHFTVGAAVEDPRLTTLPAYPGPEG